MANITYEYLFGKEPLYPTYVQLQMADQTFWFPEGIVKDVMVQIHDHYVPTDFMVLNMGEEEYDPHRLCLEDRFSTQLEQSSTWDLEKSTSSSLLRR
jgi:hypothetical protein